MSDEIKTPDLERAAQVADKWAAHYPPGVFTGATEEGRCGRFGRHVAQHIAEDIRKLVPAPPPVPEEDAETLADSRDGPGRCGEVSPGAWTCSKEKGHAGEHVACCNGRALERWLSVPVSVPVPEEMPEGLHALVMKAMGAACQHGAKRQGSKAEHEAWKATCEAEAALEAAILAALREARGVNPEARLRAFADRYSADLAIYSLGQRGELKWKRRYRDVVSDARQVSGATLAEAIAAAEEWEQTNDAREPEHAGRGSR